MDKFINYFNKNRLKSIFAYLILVLASLSISTILFMEGFPHGHDTEFHFANIYDAYYNLINNHNSPISANLASGLGVGKGLFYSPLPHMSVALLGVILAPFGISLMTSFKICLFLTYLLSGIFAYRLGLRITGGNSFAGVVAGAFYILFPYRSFDAYVRLAFAETFVFMFIPLFFLGIYNVCNDKEINTLGFIEIIFGASGLFLSHNLTAFYTFIFGFIYILFNIRGILSKINNKRLWIYAFLTVAITISITSITLFQSIDLLKNGGYNLTVPERMWTNREEVMGRVDTYFIYSGFLNVGYLNYAYSMFVTKESLYLDLGLFTIFTILFILLSEGLRNVKGINKFNTIISAIIYMILISTIINRLEVIIAGILFVSLKLLIDLDNKMFKYNLKLIKNPSLYYLILMIPLTIIMIVVPEVWKHVPELFLNIQFPWRLWVFVGFFGSMLIALLMTSIKGRVGYSLLGISLGLLIIANNPILQNRLTRIHPNPDEFDINTRVETKIDEHWFKEGMSFGANAEYLPDIYYYNIPDYKSEYKNSLYKRVNYEAFNNLGRKENVIDPVFLEGDGSIRVNSRIAPIYKMDITVNNKGLIQMPLFYYDGYEIVLRNIDTNEVKSIKGINIDGLVSFIIEEGSYIVETNYVGNTLRRSASLLNKIGTASLFILIYYYYDEKMKSFIRSI